MSKVVKQQQNKKVKQTPKTPKSTKFKVQNDNVLSKLNSLQSALGRLTKDINYYKNTGFFPGVSAEYNQVSRSLVTRREKYLRQLLDPRGAVESGKVVGLPTELPIPTTLLAYHCQNTLTNRNFIPNLSKVFKNAMAEVFESHVQFFWLPAFFNTQPNMAQMVKAQWKEDPEFVEPAPTHYFHSNLYHFMMEGKEFMGMLQKQLPLIFKNIDW